MNKPAPDPGPAGSARPAVSVITVCLNAADRLRENAGSLLSALGSGDEWIVQDGGSSDGTADLVRGFGDPRIRIESAPDAGIYDAMNRAARRVAGDFVLFLGADDRLVVSLDSVRPYLTRPETLYYGDVYRSVSADRYAGPFDGKKLARTNICQQSVFYPARVFAVRRFDTRYPLQADWVFNMACFSDPTVPFEYLPLVVAEYGQAGQSSLRMDTAFQRDYRRLLRRHFTWRQRWRPELLSRLSALWRALPGVPAPRQRSARF